MACCQHHKSPYRVAALVLSILAFLVGVTYLVPIIAGAVAVIILFVTLCAHLKQPVLYIAIVCCAVACIGNFVSAGLNDLVAIKVFAVIGGFLWFITAFLIYKIPVHPRITSENSEGTTPPQPEFDMSTTHNEPV